MWTTLSREQKLASSLFILVGISGLVLGIFYFHSRINLLKLSSAEKNLQFNVFDKDSDTFLALQQKDTDKDGINDYEETYFYNTSPYLEDSDSDGYLDKKEIDNGEDPNCIRGRICGGELLNTAGFGDVILPVEEPKPVSDPMEEIKNLSVADLKSLLRSAGLSEEELNKISDEELKNIYSQTIKQTEDQIKAQEQQTQ